MNKLQNTHIPKIYYLFFFFYFLGIHKGEANLIIANPSNYTSYLNSLVGGDTLSLSAGTYKNNLILNGRNGSASQPIVIMGSNNLFSTVFQAQSCCNTVSITKCSYLIIKNLQLDGMNIAVDAVKAEGTVGNWAHHITIEYLNIINYGSDQQNVGISTKCSTWNWLIRKNRIIGAGTGMYLGNSDGTRPFVNGIIENNYIANTLGYNIEIKHQFTGVRDSFPETMVNGHTIIRYNVFTKDITSSTGANARPNLLVGGFPLSGWGAQDYYEIYGNLFYNNPVEALFQGTGNIMMYENIFVNHLDPSGVRAVYITPQNGVSPQDIKVYHNTIWAVNASGGLRLYSPNTAYKQYCYANAVFAPQAITNFTDTLNNKTDTYTNAGNYIISASTLINTLNLYPKNTVLSVATTPNAIFKSCSNWDRDFNNDSYDWTYRGAYSGCCTNNGWHLQLDTMPSFKTASSGVAAINQIENNVWCYPNPFNEKFTIHSQTNANIEIQDVSGRIVYFGFLNAGENKLNMETSAPGIYFIQISSEEKQQFLKIIKND